MPDILWLLLLLNLAVMVVWFCHDAYAVCAIDPLFGLGRIEDGQTTYLQGFLPWDPYGSRAVLALIFLTVQLGVLIGLLLRTPAGDIAALVWGLVGWLVSLGVILMLPKFWKWSTAYRLALQKRHFIAVLQEIRRLPRDCQTQFVRDEITYDFQPDQQSDAAFVLERIRPPVGLLEQQHWMGFWNAEQDRLSLVVHMDGTGLDFLVESLPDENKPGPIRVTPERHLWTYHLRTSRRLAPGFRLNRYEQVESEEVKKIWEELGRD